ncbi:MAG: hypothetical protein GY906_25415, partial [bacterium]|nr:hypothetical protein [bacterium]
GETFTTTDTGGCSCEQIVEEEGLGNGHTKFGCSLGAMRNWIEAIESHIGRMQRHETQQNMTPRKVSIQRN